MPKKKNLPYKVKITVLKRLSPTDLGFKMDGNVVRDIPVTIVKGNIGACKQFKDGQMFTVGEDGNMPEGFCTTAWINIYSTIKALRMGGDPPWFEEEGVAINCCIDGLRPVIFKVERI